MPAPKNTSATAGSYSAQPTTPDEQSSRERRRNHRLGEPSSCIPASKLSRILASSQIKCDTVALNFGAKPLKTNESDPKEVRHFFTAANSLRSPRLFGEATRLSAQLVLQGTFATNHERTNRHTMPSPARPISLKKKERDPDEVSHFFEGPRIDFDRSRSGHSACGSKVLALRAVESCRG